jgi:GNAT superfamily N-acetyltransferase
MSLIEKTLERGSENIYSFESSNGKVISNHVYTPNRPFLITLAMHFNLQTQIDYRCTYITLGKADIELTNFEGGTTFITNFNVPQKYSGKGHGSRALKTLCLAADWYNMNLQLTCEPSEDYDYPFPSLCNFYKKHGFVEGELYSGYMTRLPN